MDISLQTVIIGNQGTNGGLMVNIPDLEWHFLSIKFPTLLNKWIEVLSFYHFFIGSADPIIGRNKSIPNQINSKSLDVRSAISVITGELNINIFSLKTHIC